MDIPTNLYRLCDHNLEVDDYVMLRNAHSSESNGYKVIGKRTDIDYTLYQYSFVNDDGKEKHLRKGEFKKWHYRNMTTKEEAIFNLLTT